MMLCTVIGCNSPRHQTNTTLYSRCTYHMRLYWRDKHDGGLIAIERAAYKHKDATLCVIDGCNNPRRVTQSGHCKRCDAHQREYRKTEFDKRQVELRTQNRVCVVAGCNEPRCISKSGKFVYSRCKNHQRQHKRLSGMTSLYSRLGIA